MICCVYVTSACRGSRSRMAEARAVLRSLLRTVNTQLTSVSGNRLWHDEVISSHAL